jgi:hypothetical protein
MDAGQDFFWIIAEQSLGRLTARPVVVAKSG